MTSLYFGHKNKVSRFQLWKLPMGDVYLLIRLIEPFFAVMASGSLMVKHTWK